jgi:glucose/arabinose dehydrogenase
MKNALRLLVALGVAGSLRAATPPSGFVDTVVASASAPTAIAYEPGSQALFVIEKGSVEARVLRKTPGSPATTALTIPCVDGSGERGLLGIAFDPDYLAGAASRYVYLYYTRLVPASGACALAGTAGSRNRVVRYLESSGTLSGEQMILEGPVLNAATNHNAGTLRFAPDKTLFVSMGDNDTDADPAPASRNLNDLRGKILRIRRDGSIPPDNPFVGQAGRRAEIWAWGLRNPFRFSIDPQTGIPWIADVGENRWEEIDRGQSGGDYGYPCLEGPDTFQPCGVPPANPIAPAYAYHHFQTPPVSGNSITGGPVYRNGTFPAAYQGRIFFGDYTGWWIRSGAIDAQGMIVDVQLFMPDAISVVDIVQAPSGCLAWVDISSGAVHETCASAFDTDTDGDGFTPAEGDCDDADASTHPGAPDVCDHKNNDCVGAADDATCAAFDPTGGVDGEDLAVLGRAFTLCNGTGASVDYTHDGCADGDDLAVMAAVWGCRGTVPICP